MNFDKYKPEDFQNAFNRWGERLKEIFSTPGAKTRLTVSVELGLPMARLLEVPVLEAFGAEAYHPRLRQFVGHIGRYVMVEQLGFELDEPEVPIKGGTLFTRGARYRVKSLTLEQAV